MIACWWCPQCELQDAALRQQKLCPSPASSGCVCACVPDYTSSVPRFSSPHDSYPISFQQIQFLFNIGRFGFLFWQL